MNRVANPEKSTLVFEWQGKDRLGRPVSGVTRASGDKQLQASLLRQGIVPSKVRRQRAPRGKRVQARDTALFTRQLATLMKAGVPLLQAFDILGRANANPQVARLLSDICSDVQTGTSLSASLHKHPQHFDKLYVHLVQAGETSGRLDDLLERLARYLEKREAIKSKITSALMYPVAVLVVAVVVVLVIMLVVVPSFQEMFSAFGADLPGPTLLVIWLSERFIAYGWLFLGGLGLGLVGLLQIWRHSLRMQQLVDRLVLKLPLMGSLVEKAVVARWTRTLATMFAAGVPLVEALSSVGGASGHSVYASATVKIQLEVSTGTSLTQAMTLVNLFPSMVIQMCAIGEASGSLDHMLGKAADFYEAEVDDRVAGLSSLLEPFIIVVLGSLIGGIVTAMYLPIFKLGQVV
jgi:type IV pilus assembly protein PilC